MPDITTSDLDFAGQEGRSIVQRIDQLEVELQRRGNQIYFYLFISSPTYEVLGNL